MTVTGSPSVTSVGWAEQTALSRSVGEAQIHDHAGRQANAVPLGRVEYDAYMTVV